MFGLEQAALLAHMQLSNLLIEGGYMPIIGSQNTWNHVMRETIFFLCVDDSGVKVYSKEANGHLQATVQKTHT